MESGNGYFCAWGPGCERAHDIYDDMYVHNEVVLGRKTDFDLLMTDWFPEDPLEQSLYYALNDANVDDKFEKECSTVVVTVGNENWEKEIEIYLSDISTFEDWILDMEDD